MIFHQGNSETYQVAAVAPKYREDGSLFDPGDISHYLQVLSYEGGSALESAVDLTFGQFDEVIDIDAQVPGQYVYGYKSVDTDGQVSNMSGTVVLNILASETSVTFTYTRIL